MKILVVDDEELARKKVLKLIGDKTDEVVLFEASNGKEAITAIEEQRPDLLFLDIQMTDMSGFDVLRKMPASHEPVVIFATAFDHFAVKAFEIQALDFLLKPFTKARFYAALERGMQKVREQEPQMNAQKLTKLLQYIDQASEATETEEQNEYLKKIALKLGNKYVFINTADIKYIKSSAYYANIFTMANATYLHRISMTAFMNKLDPNHFIRINRSTIINIHEIAEMASEGHGDYSLKMKDNKMFSITKNYKEAFLKKMNVR